MTADFYRTFQWGRELRRSGYRSTVAVTFVIPDKEIVTVGRFGAPGATMTAAQAIAHFASSPDALGEQVLIARRIEPREIRSIRPAPSIIGWRFYPEAKGRERLWPPPGTINARKNRARIEAKYG